MPRRTCLQTVSQILIIALIHAKGYAGLLDVRSTAN